MASGKILMACGASVNIARRIQISNWVQLDPILAASGSICGTQAHIRGTKSSFWDTLEPRSMSAECGPTTFEIPCEFQMSILHDVRSGIEGYGGGPQGAPNLSGIRAI